MQQIKNASELRSAVADGPRDFRMLLDGGLFSRKTISLCGGRFEVLNHISDTVEKLTERQLYTHSNIGEAMELGAFVLEPPDAY